MMGTKRRGRPGKSYTGRFCVLDMHCKAYKYESDKPICCADCVIGCASKCMNTPERCGCSTYRLPESPDPVTKWEAYNDVI